ncbi:MAG: AAA family ATPase [Burkholderiaceae bacterium]
MFRESEVIENSFEIFIRTLDYENKQKAINERLKEIHIDSTLDQQLGMLLSTGQSVLDKLSKTAGNELKKTGLIKSLTSSENIFKLPDSIKKFQPLMEKGYNVEWVGWKSEGGKYDDNSICPFCTTDLVTEYAAEKKIFTDSYTKSNVKNIKEILSFFNAVSDYMDSAKREFLYKCIKENEDEDTILLNLKHFYNDLEYLVAKIRKVIGFDFHHIKREDISKLGEHLKNLMIDSSQLIIFTSEITLTIISDLNAKIEKIVEETEKLKQEIGSLKGMIGTSISNAVTDINDFLDMSGINYALEIQYVSEKDTKTILKYKGKDRVDVSVDNIKSHLSWGERNAFALVLFMHYAISREADLIILDDPISSFDSNKKYAIINRLFLNNPQKKSLYKRTVIMLTHDFQPVIDFIVNSKPNGGSACASFLRNDGGIISETEISKPNIRSLPILLAESAADSNLNKIHRIVCLRKLLEHTKKTSDQGLAYNLLSCLLKGKQSPSFVDEAAMSVSDIARAEACIQLHIAGFSYSDYLTSVFNKVDVVKIFKEETNDYFKLQASSIQSPFGDHRSPIKD